MVKNTIILPVSCSFKLVFCVEKYFAKLRPGEPSKIETYILSRHIRWGGGLSAKKI